MVAALVAGLDGRAQRLVRDPGGRDVLRSAGPDGDPQRCEFQRPADLDEFGQLARSEPRHGVPAAGQVVDQSLPDERHERLPDGDAADVVGGGEDVDLQDGAGRHEAGDDVPADGVQHRSCHPVILPGDVNGQPCSALGRGVA